MSADLRRLVVWFAEVRRDLPWRRPEAGPWGVLVSEVMLQQTPVVRVLPVFELWLRRWPTPAALAAEPSGEAIRAWGRLGYPRRALRLHAAATAIVAEHGGRVPDDLDHLLALPGVGTYTARAVAAFAHGRRHAVIDTNVRRVVARWQQGRADLASMSLTTVESLLPDEDDDAVTVSAALMELGALVCTARAPRCDRCPFAVSCAWRAAGFPASATPVRRRQTYAGTDRQVRGRMLALLREATGPPARRDLLAVCPDPQQALRALTGLLDDGLLEAYGDDLVTLPGSASAASPASPASPAGSGAFEQSGVEGETGPEGHRDDRTGLVG
ncbi:MAG TPA: A/G-specific adenine glycosylase [Frankiaceae bacterium]|nr:A/G-specific adenine glycosylase [Frankiaceae bacterium]